MSNTQKNITENIDILQELDIKQEIERLQSDENLNISKSEVITEEVSSIEEEKINELKKLNIKREIEKLESEKIQNISSLNTSEKVEKEEAELNQRKEKRIKKNKRIHFISWIIFVTKYLITSALIFAVLLVTTNYSAYINIAKSYIYADELVMAQQRLVTSVEASNIKDKYKETAKEKVEEEKNEVIEKEKIETKLSINKMKKKQDKKEINLDIEITPYSNRVIIPKIWKNIPLVDIKNRNIDWENELNDIFMKELENWIIRYPGSSKPWEDGTSFIFWHSSNFPWIKWDYNDVFALLDNVSYSDEIIVYYGQEKFKYRIREKKVITPGDVSVLERNKDKSEITLMTCWPIWTTLNRLIVVWELVDENWEVIETVKK